MVLWIDRRSAGVGNLPVGDLFRFEEIDNELVAMAGFAKSMNL